MIIKQTRIRTGGTATALGYIQAMGENEDVELLYGDPATLGRYVNTLSAMNRHAYVLRHFIISPEQELNDVQIDRCIEAIQNEFQTGDRPYVVAKHKKTRSDDNDASHIHIMMAESSTTGKVLTNRNNFKRNEKICRNLELEFGFELVKGRHNKYVIGHTENANNQLAMHLIGIADDDLPQSAYTKTMLGKARRVGVDLTQLHKALKEVQAISSEKSEQRAEFITRTLLDADISLKKGNKEGIIVLYKYDEKTKKDVEFGSLARLTKLNKQDIAAIYQFIKSKVVNDEQTDRATTGRNRANPQSDPINYGRSEPGYRWPDALGRNSGTANNHPSPTDEKYRFNPNNWKISANILRKTGYMASVKAITRKRISKGMISSAGAANSYTGSSSGSGPTITDVFNDGAAALRAATNSIETPRV